MKTLILPALMASMAAPLFAQQSAAPSPDLSHLRENYVDSLDRLLIQDVKANDLTDARAVIDEIEKVSPQQASPAPVQSATNSVTAAAPDTANSPCGTWVWDGGVLLVAFNADGTVSRDGKVTKSVWHWVDQPNRTLRIDWTSGWVDHLTLADDGQSMDCLNNNGGQFTVHRLPKDDQSSTATAN
jgi:hypothetical protein